MFKSFGDGLESWDFPTFARCIDALHDEIPFNNLTLYTLSGVKSALPYLPSPPSHPNVASGNALARRFVEHVQSRGITFGAMLQLLSHSLETWKEPVIGGMTPEKLADIAEINGGQMPETTPITADFTDPRFTERLLAIVREHLDIFPTLDYLFLEFEGVDFVPRAQLEPWYHRWARPLGKPDFDHLTYSPETLNYCRSIFTEPDFFWSEECRAMFLHYHRRNLNAVDNLLRELGWRGTVGVVFHLYGYESRLFPDALPNPDWWLLPWHYWNPNFEPKDVTPAMITRKKAVSKASLRRWTDEGKKVCYIGDVALGKNGLEGVKEFYDYILTLDPVGYLGLGLPDPTIGAHWVGVEDSDLLAARELYKTLY